MQTSHRAAEQARSSALITFALSPRGVVLLGVLMVLAQAAFRGWAISGAWFQLDDTNFQIYADTEDAPGYWFEGYNGHLMPGGMAVTWLFQHAFPFAWAAPASYTLFLQVLASVGLLVFLTSAFGRRPAVLAPLALYLTSAMSIPAFMWWAAAVNQMPLQVALTWGAWTHLNYLRTRRLRWLVATAVITVYALFFWQKSLFVFALWGFMGLAYFARGDLLARFRTLWTNYRLGLVVHGALALAYLAAYVRRGLNFAPSDATAGDTPLMEVGRYVISRYISGATGGPFRWHLVENSYFGWPDPTDLQFIIAFALFGFLVWELCRTHSRAKRALLLPAIFLTLNIALISSGRATIAGAIVAADFRYQTEMPIINAIALGLMILPLRGAVEVNERTRAGIIVGHPVRAVAATLALAAMSLYSSMPHITHFRDATQSREWLTTARAELDALEQPVALINANVPDFVVFPFSYPANTYEKVFSRWADVTQFPDYSVDTLHVFGADGTLQPALVSPVRKGVPTSLSCPFPPEDGRIEIPLDGAVAGVGFWTRFEYGSDRDTPLNFHVGDEVRRLNVPQGLHSVYVRSDGTYDALEITGLDPDAQFCVTLVEVGSPVGAEDALGALGEPAPAGSDDASSTTTGADDDE